MYALLLTNTDDRMLVGYRRCLLQDPLRELTLCVCVYVCIMCVCMCVCMYVCMYVRHAVPFRIKYIIQKKYQPLGPQNYGGAVWAMEGKKYFDQGNIFICTLPNKQSVANALVTVVCIHNLNATAVATIDQVVFTF